MAGYVTCFVTIYNNTNNKSISSNDVNGSRNRSGDRTKDANASITRMPSKDLRSVASRACDAAGLTSASATATATGIPKKLDAIKKYSQSVKNSFFTLSCRCVSLFLRALNVNYCGCLRLKSLSSCLLLLQLCLPLSLSLSVSHSLYLSLSLAPSFSLCVCLFVRV